jgi:rubrerythrin
MELTERIKWFIEVEQAAVSIYSSFMNLFPEEKDFWRDLLKDEVEHSSFLKDTDFLQIINKLPIHVESPSVSVIEKTLAFTQNTIRHITSNPISLIDALNITLKLEESMVETYTNVLIADLKAINDKTYFMNFEKMLFEEKGHINKVRNMMISKGYLDLS